MFYNKYNNEYFGNSQQIMKIFLEELELPSDDPIYTLKEVMKELDFSKLLNQYKSKGRRGYNPIMMFALIIYANMRGIRSVDDIVDACKRDICFMTLANKETPARDAFYRFKNDKVTEEILEDLHYQLIIKLKEKGYVSLEKMFVDGTKIEANANRYTFVWRGSVNYHLVNLLNNINKLYTRYNEMLIEEKYDMKYGTTLAEMIIIEGSKKVIETIEKNRIRKKQDKKKLSNNTILKIDNIDKEAMDFLLFQVEEIMKAEKIMITTGKGNKKTQIQRIYDDFKRYGKRLTKYKENFEIMGEDRNSYSKTDNDATFMRMKDDHMMNGQLKPGYNVQFATENYFITDVLVSNDRTDYHTLIPLVEKHEKYTKIKLDEFIADSGYCSEKGLRYLTNKNIKPFIKLQEHEIKKTRKYKNNIGKYYNMNQQDENTYICADGRKLEFEYEKKSNKQGFEQKYKIYCCKSCDGCQLKKDCLYNFNPEKDVAKNKTLNINRKWDELKSITEENIHSEKGIIYRQIRSIQSEGTFGDMKENDDFRKFNYRSQGKAHKELLFYVIGRNINKLHRFETNMLKEFLGNTG